MNFNIFDPLCLIYKICDIWTYCIFDIKLDYVTHGNNNFLKLLYWIFKIKKLLLILENYIKNKWFMFYLFIQIILIISNKLSVKLKFGYVIPIS